MMSSDSLVFLKEQFLSAFTESLKRTLPQDRSLRFWKLGVWQGLNAAFYISLITSLETQLKLSQNPQEPLAWVLKRIEDNYTTAQKILNTPGLYREALTDFSLDKDINVLDFMLRECLSLYENVQTYQKQLASYFQAPSADMRYDPQNPKATVLRVRLPAKRVPDHAKLLIEIGKLITKVLFQQNIVSLLDQIQAQALISFLFDLQSKQPMPKFSPELFERILLDLQRLFRLSYQDHEVLRKLVLLVTQQQRNVYEVFGRVADAHEFGHKREVPSEIPILQTLIARVSENGCFSAPSQESTETPKLAAKL